jgi:hypothetical protein
MYYVLDVHVVECHRAGCGYSMLVGILFCNSIGIVAEAGVGLALDPKNMVSFLCLRTVAIFGSSVVRDGFVFRRLEGSGHGL